MQKGRPAPEPSMAADPPQEAPPKGDAEVNLFQQIIRASRLHPSVAPYTVRRLLLRRGVFDSAAITPAHLAAILPELKEALQRFLTPSQYAAASEELDQLSRS